MYININSNMDTKKLIEMEKSTICLALSSCFGIKIDNSYRPATSEPNNTANAKYKAKVPKSEGEYNLVNMGLMAIGMA